MKRLVALFLVLAMCFSLAACGGGKGGSASNEVTEVTFPLEEQVTFTFMLEGTESVTFAEDLANNALWKSLEEKTNVHIDFQFLGDAPSEKLALLVNGNNYGDVIFGGPMINSVEASKYIAAGILADITDYLVEDLMPNFKAELDENPSIMNAITASDGRVYTLPKITGLEGHYLESPIWVNKAWLDKVGMGVPTTLDEFTAMLQAFADKDPNGNGLPDEIPYICATGQSAMHMEALLGMWGIATKDSTNDSFMQVVDGKVQFAPATEGYKEAIQYLAMLYDKGLMWSECFTADDTAIQAKLNSETPVVGCFTAMQPTETAYRNDYVCIAPPKVDGYEACWYYHPAFNGSNNQFFVTDKCENLSVLMAWIDQFYDLDVTMSVLYGEIGEGRMVKNDEGKYERIELDAATTAKLNKEKPTLGSLLGNIICSISTSDFANNVKPDTTQTIAQSNYGIYKEYITKEPWPRPYLSADDSYDADVYTTDINYEVTVKRANWITGKSDINSEWDAYIKKLNELGLEEYVDIMQRAYDTNQSNSK